MEKQRQGARRWRRSTGEKRLGFMVNAHVDLCHTGPYLGASGVYSDFGARSKLPRGYMHDTPL